MEEPSHKTWSDGSSQECKPEAKNMKKINEFRLKLSKNRLDIYKSAEVQELWLDASWEQEFLRKQESLHSCDRCDCIQILTVYECKGWNNIPEVNEMDNSSFTQWIYFNLHKNLKTINICFISLLRNSMT